MQGENSYHCEKDSSKISLCSGSTLLPWACSKKDIGPTEKDKSRARENIYVHVLTSERTKELSEN